MLFSLHLRLRSSLSLKCQMADVTVLLTQSNMLTDHCSFSSLHDLPIGLVNVKQWNYSPGKCITGHLGTVRWVHLKGTSYTWRLKLQEASSIMWFIYCVFISDAWNFIILYWKYLEVLTVPYCWHIFWQMRGKFLGPLWTTLGFTSVLMSVSMLNMKGFHLST